jgi:hypothetical protein
VLEFDEFLKIEGCKTGKHLFVKKKRGDEVRSIMSALSLPDNQLEGWPG